jgi:hypothetical protein
MTKPAVFVGSSTEGLDFARAVRNQLIREAEITLWNEGFFKLGHTFIETLVNELPRFDFAILVLTPDDLVNSRETEVFGPRDNVIFELGLFMGYLGRTRTFIVYQASAELKLPSDLSGVAAATYDWPRVDKNHQSAVGAACDTIRNSIRDQGVSERKAEKEVEYLKDRQETTESRINDAVSRIDKIFAYTMSESMYLNLQKISSGNFGHFVQSEGLSRELRHLRNIGYITVKGTMGGLPLRGVISQTSLL